MKTLLLSAGLLAGLGAALPAEASVTYSFMQTGFQASRTPPSPGQVAAPYTLRFALTVTDAELAAGAITRASNSLDQIGYDLVIGRNAALSGTITGLLAAYDFRLNGREGVFSGDLTYGNFTIPSCGSPGCSIQGTLGPVPEPASIATLAIGLLGFAAARRKARSI